MITERERPFRPNAKLQIGTRGYVDRGVFFKIAKEFVIDRCDKRFNGSRGFLLQRVESRTEISSWIGKGSHTLRICLINERPKKRTNKYDNC